MRVSWPGEWAAEPLLFMIGRVVIEGRTEGEDWHVVGHMTVGSGDESLSLTEGTRELRLRGVRYDGVESAASMTVSVDVEAAGGGGVPPEILDEIERLRKKARRAQELAELAHIRVDNPDYVGALTDPSFVDSRSYNSSTTRSSAAVGLNLDAVRSTVVLPGESVIIAIHTNDPNIRVRHGWDHHGTSALVGSSGGVTRRYGAMLYSYSNDGGEEATHEWEVHVSEPSYIKPMVQKWRGVSRIASRHDRSGHAEAEHWCRPFGDDYHRLVPRGEGRHPDLRSLILDIKRRESPPHI